MIGPKRMKLALKFLTAIDPSIGGVLVFGDQWHCSKSTIVRSLIEIMQSKILSQIAPLIAGFL